MKPPLICHKKKRMPLRGLVFPWMPSSNILYVLCIDFYSCYFYIFCAGLESPVGARCRCRSWDCSGTGKNSVPHRRRGYPWSMNAKCWDFLTTPSLPLSELAAYFHQNIHATSPPSYAFPRPPPPPMFTYFMGAPLQKDISTDLDEEQFDTSRPLDLESSNKMSLLSSKSVSNFTHVKRRGRVWN